jgi:hypothetical protein
MALGIRRHRSWWFALPALVLLALAAVACRQVGYGDLRVANDLSGIGRDNTWIRAFVADPGDVWPPAGYVNLWVKGDDFGRPPAYGLDGYLYLVRSDAACPQSEGAPEVFRLSDVTIVGIVTVKLGSVDQFLLMQDAPANRQATWALIETGEFPDTGGGHLILRCGGVTWSP